jgi:hypothetical protein
MSQGIPPVAQLTQLLFGYMISQSISVAAKLGVADLLKDGPLPAEALAEKTGTHAGALYRLLRALASAGIFAEDEAGRFQLTPMAESLRSDAPGSLRHWAIYSGAEFHQRVWQELEYSVKTGKPAIEKISGGKEAFEWLTEHPAEAQIFNNAMTSMSQSASQAIVAAYDFSGITKLCDVGGGHGFLLSSILKVHPKMKGVLIDLPFVVSGASALIEAQGVADRIEVVGGSFFDSVPAGCDAYILKSVIHDWSDERSLTILRNCHQVMSKGHKLFLVEMVLPEGNVPSLGKLVDLEMLLHLHSHERTERQYRTLLEGAGFELKRVMPTPSPYSVIEATRV